MENNLKQTILSLLTFSDNIKNQLTEVTYPLTEIFDSTYFYYIKYFLDNNKRLILSTRVDCLEYFLTGENFSIMNPIFQNVVEEIFTYNQKYYLWTGQPTDTTHQAFFEHDIWHGCTFYTKTGSVIEACGVATKRENEKIINKYVNYLDVFSRFLFYFREKFSNFINNPDEKILLPSNIILPTDYQSNPNEFANFIKKTQIKSFPIITDSKNAFITKREAEVMYYLSQGKTSKEVALTLNISPRTVESYIESVKLKLSCFSRSKAIELFLHSYGAHNKILFL